MNQYIDTYKNSEKYYNSRVIKLSIPLLLFFCGLYLSKRDLTDFKRFVDLYTAAVGSALMVLLYLMKIKSQDRLMRYLAWGYVFVALILFIRIEFDLGFFTKTYNKTYLLGILSANLFEIIVIYLSIYAYKFNMSFLRTMLLFVCFFFITVAFYRIIINNMNYYNVFFSHSLLFLLISTIAISKLINFRGMFRKSDYYPIIFFIFFQVYYNIMLFLNIMHLVGHIIFYSYLFRFLGFLCIFWLMEKKILKLSYNREVEEITRKQIERRKLNISLRKQKRALEEIEYQTRRSVIRNKEIIDKIPEIIIIFKGDYLEYMNKYANDYLNIQSKVTKPMVNLDNLLSELIKNVECRNLIYNGYEQHIIINNKSGTELKFKVSLVNLNEDNRVLIMKSNKDEVENLELMKKYNYHLKEEEIMEEFYANISHELRTPINVIYSALQLNAMAIEEKRKDIIIRNHGVIKQNCKRLIRTINNFIDSNKISDGYIDGNKKVFNIVYLVDEIVEATSRYMEMKKNSIIFDPREEQVFIYASVDHIMKVILNILSNALKYGKENSKIFIITYTLKGKFYMEIVYKGDPIPEKKLSYVFRRFTKLDDYLNRTSEGSGLGLFLAKKLVEQNGGNIDIFSEKIGNVATITLPVVNEYKSDRQEVENYEDITELVDIEFSDIYF